MLYSKYCENLVVSITSGIHTLLINNGCKQHHLEAHGKLSTYL